MCKAHCYSQSLLEKFNIQKIKALTAAYHCNRDLHAKYCSAEGQNRAEHVTICFTNEWVQSLKSFIKIASVKFYGRPKMTICPKFIKNLL